MAMGLELSGKDDRPRGKREDSLCGLSASAWLLGCGARCLGAYTRSAVKSDNTLVQWTCSIMCCSGLWLESLGDQSRYRLVRPMPADRAFCFSYLLAALSLCPIY